MSIPGAYIAEDGTVALTDGVGAMTRGDMLIAVYVGDARLHRSIWLFELAQALSARNPEGIVAMILIPQSSKPPDQETRSAEVAAFKRMGKQLRRVVNIPEGHAFHVSIVRMVIGAYVTLTGMSASHFVAKSLEHGISLIGAAKSARTPDANQINADVATLRSALAHAGAAS